MVWIEKRKFKRGIRYYVATRINGQHKLIGKCNSYELALRVRNQAEENAESKKHGFIDDTIILNTLVEKYLKDSANVGKAIRTIDISKQSLNKLQSHYGELRIISITNHHLERFKLWLLEKEYSVNGVKIILRNIKTFFNYCIRNGWIKDNPAKSTDNLKAEPVARFLTEKEIKKLKESCCFNKTLWKICKVALFTGMRRGEILNLHSDQIKNGYIHLDSKMTKTRKSRIVPIHKEIRNILNRKGKIFEGWGINRLNRAFRRAVRRSELPSFRFHDLKHTFISQLMKKTSIADVSAITGNTLESLKVYMHFSPSDLRQKLDGMRY